MTASSAALGRSTADRCGVTSSSTATSILGAILIWIDAAELLDDRLGGDDDGGLGGAEVGGSAAGRKGGG